MEKPIFNPIKIKTPEDIKLFKPSKPWTRKFPKIGRNHYCPCGSGKKFKKCCLNKTK